jgi:hypothetical protein
MMGWLGVGLLVVLLALVVCSWWLGTLCASADHVRPREPREPAMPIRAPRLPRAMSPRHVVILDECEDGVFRAI